MISGNTRLIGIALTVTLAACGAKVDVPSGSAGVLNSAQNSAQNAASVVRPSIRYKFYLINETGSTLKEYARSANCMRSLPEERYLQPRREEYSEEVDTSNDPACFIRDSDIKFDFYVVRAQNGGGRGTIKWIKSSLEHYKIKTEDEQKICFGQSGGGPYQTVKIHPC